MGLVRTRIELLTGEHSPLHRTIPWHPSRMDFIRAPGLRWVVSRHPAKRRPGSRWATTSKSASSQAKVRLAIGLRSLHDLFGVGGVRLRCLVACFCLHD